MVRCLLGAFLLLLHWAVCAGCVDAHQVKRRLIDIAMLCASPEEGRFTALIENPTALDIKISVPARAERVLPVLKRRWATVEKDLRDLIHSEKEASSALERQMFDQKLQSFRKNLVFVWAFRFWQKFNPVGHNTVLHDMVREELGACVAERLSDTLATYVVAHDFALGMVDVFTASGHDIQGFLAVSRACKAFWRRATLSKSGYC